MSRSIKFKFMFTDGVSWISKVLTLSEIMNGEAFEVTSDQPFLKKYKMVAELQYTGTYDCNGVEIYEGDILEQSLFPEDDECQYSVFFENGSYRKKYRDWDEGLDNPILNQTEIGYLAYCVIGNIHQNPELLEQSK